MGLGVSIGLGGRYGVRGLGYGSGGGYGAGGGGGRPGPASPPAPPPPPHTSPPRPPTRRLVASAGGWTTLLLGALLVAALPLARPGVAALLRAVGRWAVGVALARSAPRFFAALEAATGRCLSPVAGGILLLPHGDPRSCRAEGHRWEGFGASPQAFALVHCGLGLAEEAGALGRILYPPWRRKWGREGARRAGVGPRGTSANGVER
ncbi:fat storage-inducing transmembrane protein 1-like [Aquila chrysaetos chrysaetos]|uniref:fat storage-inducing transmembrane protein 1-like n=1 Tax=Aquila chrysaetos chrysaetos TaxID=223781 RepID=UPI001176B3C9|nr:fat storage-inducing transmembrane protein 1-like [Aquila chrysaetos chrysaetos]